MASTPSSVDVNGWNAAITARVSRKVGRRGLAALGQILADGEQPLEGPVVQSLGQPAALVVGDVEHLAEQPGPVGREALHLGRPLVGHRAQLRH